MKSASVTTKQWDEEYLRRRREESRRHYSSGCRNGKRRGRVVSQIYASRGGKADYEAVLARNSGGITVKGNVDKQIATQKEKGANDATLKAMRDAATMNIEADTTIEPVMGVGEAAYWSAKHRYICVLHKDTVFQIKVDYKEGENKQKAIEIAQEVLKKI